MINFPSNPTDGQVVTAGRKSWKYALAKKVWNLLSTPDAAADAMEEMRTSVDTIAPTAGLPGKEWVNPVTLKRYVRIQDANGEFVLVEAAGFYYVDDGVSVKAAQDAAAAVAFMFPGAYAVAPTTRPGGSALQAGDIYFSSVTKMNNRWSGTVWVASDLNPSTLAAVSGSSLIGTNTVTSVLQSIHSRV